MAAMSSCCYDVPEAVVVEIFSWLPPKSLNRFKCVCKSWNSLMSNPAFVGKHLRNARVLLLNLSNDDGENEEIHSTAEELRVDNPLGGGRISDVEFFRMMGTFICRAEFYQCDGVICLAAPDNIMLWNPALHESRLLPLSGNACHFQFNLGVGKSGFGYDPVDNDYKVVRMWFDDIELIEIYSLNTNTWREIKVGFDKHDYEVQHKMQVCYQGIYCWFFSEGESATNMMLSFDLHAEKFYFIPLPGAIKSCKTLIVWNDSIAYVSSSQYGEGTEPIEMWVMECCSSTGVGDSFSWI